MEYIVNDKLLNITPKLLWEGNKYNINDTISINFELNKMYLIEIRANSSVATYLFPFIRNTNDDQWIQYQVPLDNGEFICWRFRIQKNILIIDGGSINLTKSRGILAIYEL